MYLGFSPEYPNRFYIEYNKFIFFHLLFGVYIEGSVKFGSHLGPFKGDTFKKIFFIIKI